MSLRYVVTKEQSKRDLFCAGTGDAFQCTDTVCGANRFTDWPDGGCAIDAEIAGYLRSPVAGMSPFDKAGTL